MTFFNVRHLAFTLLFLPFALYAGWEDIDVSSKPSRRRTPAAPVATQRPAPTYRAPAAPAPRRRPVQTYQAPPPSRPAPAPRHVVKPPAPVTGLLPPDLYSAFLDARQESRSWYRFRIMLPSSLSDMSAHGDLTYVELDAHFFLWEYRNLIGGDFSVGLNPATTVFVDDADLDHFPTLLLKLPVDVDWNWRFVNGVSLDIGAAPGIYSDIGAMDGDMFSVPFHVCFYYSVDPTVSLRGGVEIRSGWDETAMPLIGLAWRPNEMFRLELGAPRTMAQLQMGPIELYGKAEWRNVSYNMSGDDNEPDTLTLNDWMFAAGLSIDFAPTTRLTVEAGYLIDRSIKGENDSGEDELDVDSAPFFGILFGSEF